MTLTNFDKQKVKEQLTLENVFELASDLGGDPQYTDFGIMCSTICHNMPGVGSRKLYYYTNSGLWTCYTGCGESFDSFQLVMKAFQVQKSKELDLNDAIRFVASKFNIAGEAYDIDLDTPLDWKIFDSYDSLQEVEVKDYNITLPEYDSAILDRLNYNIEITPWLEEDIKSEVISKTQIGYYPGADMITIPHFDTNDRFIGLRGRALAADDVERYGKYRPIKIMKQMYNHPLGMNLYGLNWAKNAIKILGKAIIFESEKSVLKYMSLFGIDNNIAVACCGSNISAYQIHQLLDAGAKEIILAMDRQFQELGDKECEHLIKNLTKVHDKYKNEVDISIIFDKNMITSYKASPIDEGAAKFLKLFNERIILN